MRIVSILLLAAALFACGDDDSKGSGSSGSSSNSSDYSCCLNGSYFQCPNEDALNQCGQQLDPSGCSRDSSKDDTC